jgi:thiamine biosynthesis lipoprotein
MSTHAEFAVFGSYGFIAVRRPAVLADALELARTVVSDVDATCSRFRDDSDLTRVNRHAGQWVEVHPLLVEAVRVAVDAACATDGLVDPLLGRALVTLGYDRDFDELVELERTASGPPEDPTPGSWREIGLDHDRIRIPAGTALDLGSTAKAWASDLVASAVETELGEPAVVSLGGDIRIASPDGRPWRVAITERHGDAARTVVDLDGGGLATSSTQVRRWLRGGAGRHHLLDPQTGLPATEVWRTVTATGPSCVAANTASTAAIVLGDAAPQWLHAHEVTARLVAADGHVVGTGDWPLDDERAA